MILLFDSLITDVPLVKGLYSELDDIRKASYAYRFRDRLEVTKYTLASYAVLDWSYVIIRYEFTESGKETEFEEFARGLFPDAKIINGRADTQKKFQDSVRLIEDLDDEWVFYAGNNDHPFIAPDTEVLDDCVNALDRLKEDHEFVTINYSHFTETLNAPIKGSIVHEVGYPDVELLEDNENYSVALYPNGCFGSTQIVHKHHFTKWFCTGQIDGRVVRAEDVEKHVPIRNQVMINPKRPLCEHYDGYSHTRKFGYYIPTDVVPPLFIPDGFFERKVRIAYGYDNNRKGWVNMNPTNKVFSFRDNSTGTDLRIGLDDVPLFWKDRITETDVNPDADLDDLTDASKEYYKQMVHPWLRKSAFYYRMLRKRLELHGRLAKLIPKKLKPHVLRFRSKFQR
ncbi:hypothetical protein K9M79_00875 [Candidatus Woesearchaeota archaeon]|nr:hypothetical protein [Candidatus Woesearchaeota archaeon]